MTRLCLDHLVFAVRDLGSSSASFEALLGRRRSWRGKHSQYGTANVLYRVGSAYLELLSRDPESTVRSAWTDGIDDFLAARGEGFYAVAFGTTDIGATLSGLASRGVRVGEARAGEGFDLDTGAVRRWANALIEPSETLGIRAFVIEHRSPPGALPKAALALEAEAGAIERVIAVELAANDLTGMRRMWSEQFSLPELPGQTDIAYELGNARLRLASVAAERNLWSSVVCRVPNLAAAEARLLAAGFRVESAGGALETTSCGVTFILRETHDDE